MHWDVYCAEKLHLLSWRKVCYCIWVFKPFISFFCTWKWYNNWVYYHYYLPFTVVNYNFCLFCNKNQLVWSLEKHLRLQNVSNEEIVFWCKWQAKLRESFYFYAEGYSLSTDFVLIFWQIWTALLKSINKLQPINTRSETLTCQIHE